MGCTFTLRRLWKTITPKRWMILKSMAAQGPPAIREIARRVDRAVHAVHSDVHVLLNAGLVERTEEGRVHFPCDAIHVNFVLSTPAA